MQNESYLYFNDFYKVYKNDKGVVTCLANNGVEIPVKDMRLNIPKEALENILHGTESKYRIETKFVLRCSNYVTASVYLFAVKLTDEEITQLGEGIYEHREENKKYLEKYWHLFE